MASLKAIILFILYSLLQNVFGKNIKEEMKKIEDDIILLAKQQKEHLNNICKYNLKDSGSYLSCSENTPELSCNPNYIIKNCEMTPNCTANGHILNTKQFSVVLANEFNNKISIDQGVKEIVSASTPLKEEFENLSKKKKFYKWMYFSTYNGVHMTYPYKQRCKSYDNRYRPFFNGGITGVKNMILLIDISGDMLRFKGNQVNMATIILRSLIVTDRVGVILYNNTAYASSSILEEASVEKVDQLIKYIENSLYSGKSNIEEAFKKAKEVITNTDDIGYLLKCKTYFMLNSYGSPTIGKQGQDLLSNIGEISNLKNAKIYAYSYNGENDHYTRQIACMRSGTYENVRNNDNYYKKLDSYITSIKIGSNITTPVWIGPYSDSSGLGNVVTVVLPIYDETSYPYRKIWGLIGIDTIFEDLLALTDLKDDYFKNVLKTKAIETCSSTNFDMSECELNSLRTYKCPNVTNDCNPINLAIPTCAFDVLNETDVFKNKNDNNLEHKNLILCCNCKETILGAAIPIGIATFSGLILLITLCSCKYIKPKEINNGNNNGNNNINNNGNNNVNNNGNNNVNNNENNDENKVGINGSKNQGYHVKTICRSETEQLHTTPNNQQNDKNENQKDNLQNDGSRNEKEKINPTEQKGEQSNDNNNKVIGNGTFPARINDNLEEKISSIGNVSDLNPGYCDNTKLRNIQDKFSLDQTNKTTTINQEGTTKFLNPNNKITINQEVPNNFLNQNNKTNMVTKVQDDPNDGNKFRIIEIKDNNIAEEQKSFDNDKSSYNSDINKI